MPARLVHSLTKLRRCSGARSSECPLNHLWQESFRVWQRLNLIRQAATLPMVRGRPPLLPPWVGAKARREAIHFSGVIGRKSAFTVDRSSGSPLPLPEVNGNITLLKRPFLLDCRSLGHSWPNFMKEGRRDHSLCKLAMIPLGLAGSRRVYNLGCVCQAQWARAQN